MMRGLTATVPNHSLQRTVAPVTACADHQPPTRANAVPGPSLRSGTLRPLNSKRSATHEVSS